MFSGIVGYLQEYSRLRVDDVHLVQSQMQARRGLGNETHHLQFLDH